MNRAVERTMNEAMDCAIRVVIKPGALFKTLNGRGTSGIHIRITQPSELLLSVDLLRRKIPRIEREVIETTGLGIEQLPVA